MSMPHPHHIPWPLITTPFTMAYNIHARQQLAKEMYDILRAQGQAAYNDAMQSLADAERSPQPHFELYNALAHLQRCASNALTDGDYLDKKLKKEMSDFQEDIRYEFGGLDSFMLTYNQFLAAKYQEADCYAIIAEIFGRIGQRPNMMEWAGKYSQTGYHRDLDVAAAFLLRIGAPLGKLIYHEPAGRRLLQEQSYRF